MNLQAWPLAVWKDQWSIPYWILEKVWDEMIEKGLDEIVFYDGGINTKDEFIGYMCNPNVSFVLIVDMEDKKAVAFGYVNNVVNGVGEVHFSFMNGFVEGAGEVAIKFWEGLRDSNDEKLIHVLIGITPESYEKVHHIIQKWGFKVLGKIPDMCPMFYKNRREGAVISYLQLGG